jgi:hypothetical protein
MGRNDGLNIEAQSGYVEQGNPESSGIDGRPLG